MRAAKPVPVLVATGDSITDGYGVPLGSYQRWTDALSRRLAGQGRDAAVVNTGIGGGRLLREGLGPSLVSRFERDVLARSGATHAVVLIGVNDLGVSHRNKPTTPESRAALLAEKGKVQDLGTIADKATIDSWFHKDEFNQFMIVAKGNTTSIYMNAHLVTVFIDNDPTYFRAGGKIGPEVESTGEYWVRNIYLKRL